jgi:hypothetical protein
MGTCTEIYLFKKENLLSLIGSGQGEMRALVMQKRHAKLLQNFDAQDREKPGKAYLSDLFNGVHPTSGAEGSAYAYALKILIQEIGESLSNSQFCPYQLAWLEELDQVLQAQAIEGFLFSDLIGFQTPFAMASPDDFPGVLTLENAQIQALYSKFSAIKNKGLNSEVVLALKQAKDWFKKATETGKDLIFFTH